MSKLCERLVKRKQDALSTTAKIATAIDAAKGLDISVLDVSEVFQLSDYFLLVSGRSDRHVQGLANRVIEELAKSGLHPVNIEGFEQGHWVLVDFGDVVLHVFYQGVRDQYDLEGLWNNARKLSTHDVEQALARVAA